MRSISNPFADRPGYNCFGCSPNNDQGLQLTFAEDGEEVVTTWEPERRFAGYDDILHGGIQATLHDEIASWLVFVKLKTAGFTERLEMDYRSPVRVDSGPLTLRSRLDHVEGNKAFIRTKLLDARGKLGSESLAVFFTLPQHIAQKKMGFPSQGFLP